MVRFPLVLQGIIHNFLFDKWFDFIKKNYHSIPLDKFVPFLAIFLGLRNFSFLGSWFFSHIIFTRNHFSSSEVIFFINWSLSFRFNTENEILPSNPTRNICTFHRGNANFATVCITLPWFVQDLFLTLWTDEILFSATGIIHFTKHIFTVFGNNSIITILCFYIFLILHVNSFHCLLLDECFNFITFNHWEWRISFQSKQITNLTKYISTFLGVNANFIPFSETLLWFFYDFFSHIFKVRSLYNNI